VHQVGSVLVSFRLFTVTPILYVLFTSFAAWPRRGRDVFDFAHQEQTLSYVEAIHVASIACRGCRRKVLLFLRCIEAETLPLFGQRCCFSVPTVLFVFFSLTWLAVHVTALRSNAIPYALFCFLALHLSSS
jgi:hypothetical protein